MAAGAHSRGGFYVIPQVYGSSWFVLYLMFYLFIYRPLIDTQRLISLKEIDEKAAWRFFVPLHVSRLQYIRKLWLG